MNRGFTVETEHEAESGRWIAEVRALGAMQYGETERQAILNVVSLALHVLADKIEQGEATDEELALVLAG
jgi:hypothetical protein